MARFVWIALVAQVTMVVTGHFVEGVLMLSGILGTGIPLVVGLWYGATEPTSMGEAAKGGFLIGFVGAVVGVLLAILLGDQGWILMTFAPPSSAVTGILGAIIALVATGRHKRGGPAA